MRQAVYRHKSQLSFGYGRETTRTFPEGSLFSTLTVYGLAVEQADKVNIALGGLRQLYEACVTPVVYYISTVWHGPLRYKTHLRHLRTAQRAALIRVLSAFRPVATTTLVVKAHVLLTHTIPYTTVHKTLLLDYIPYLKSILYWMPYFEPRERETILDRPHDSCYQKP